MDILRFSCLAFSVESILPMVVNIVVTIVLGVIGYAVRRMIAQNDLEHQAMNKSMEEFRRDITAERDARHAFHLQISERIAASDKDVAVNYEKKVDAMTRFGNLVVALDRNHRETMTEVKETRREVAELPCHNTPCPQKDDVQ